MERECSEYVVPVRWRGMATSASDGYPYGSWRQRRVGTGRHYALPSGQILRVCVVTQRSVLRLRECVIWAVPLTVNS